MLQWSRRCSVNVMIMLQTCNPGSTVAHADPFAGHRKLSLISLMATEYFRTLLQSGAHGGCADPRRAMGAGLTTLKNSEASDSEGVIASACCIHMIKAGLYPHRCIYIYAFMLGYLQWRTQNKLLP